MQFTLDRSLRRSNFHGKRDASSYCSGAGSLRRRGDPVDVAMRHASASIPTTISAQTGMPNRSAETMRRQHRSRAETCSRGECPGKTQDPIWAIAASAVRIASGFKPRRRSTVLVVVTTRPPAAVARCPRGCPSHSNFTGVLGFLVGEKQSPAAKRAGLSVIRGAPQASALPGCATPRPGVEPSHVRRRPAERQEPPEI